MKKEPFTKEELEAFQEKYPFFSTEEAERRLRMKHNREIREFVVSVFLSIVVSVTATLLLH